MFFLFFNIESYLFSKEPVVARTYTHTISQKNTHKRTLRSTRTHAHTSKTCTHTHKRKHICIYSTDLCVDALFCARARALAFK